MSLLLQILGVLLIVLLVAAAVAFWWIRRKFRALFDQAERMPVPLDPTFALPGRLRLLPEPPEQASAALRAAWVDWPARGFLPLCDARDVTSLGVRLGRRDDGLLVALLEQDQVTVLVLALTEADRIVGASAGPAAEVQGPAAHWRSLPGAGPAELVAAVEAMLAAAAQRPRRLDALPSLRLLERAHAWRIDEHLVRYADARALAAVLPPGLAPDDEREAAEHGRERWERQLADVGRESWRLARSGEWIDERLLARIDVVPESISDEAVTERLGGEELADLLLVQATRRGRSGIGRYADVAARLPARRCEIGRLAEPVPMRLYLPEVLLAPDAGTLPARPYLYAAADGESGAVVARSSSEALQLLREMDVEQPRLVSDPGALEGSQQDGFGDPEIARMAVAATQQGLLRALLLRALAGNAWIWLPPAALLTIVLHGGPPFGPWSWAVFAYAAVGGVVMFLLIAPMTLYDRMLAAQGAGRFARASALLKLLRRLPRLGISSEQLTIEEARLCAAQGRTEQALARLDELRGRLGEAAYWQARCAVLAASGDHARLIEAQRQALACAEQRELATVDLALSLVRYRRDDAAAEDLLATVRADGLSEIVLCGYHFARGLIQAERGQHAAALRQYRQAGEVAEQFRQNPLSRSLLAEIGGHSALALRALGRDDEAARLWASVRPVLRAHPAARYLEGRWSLEGDRGR